MVERMKEIQAVGIPEPTTRRRNIKNAHELLMLVTLKKRTSIIFVEPCRPCDLVVNPISDCFPLPSVAIKIIIIISHLLRHFNAFFRRGILIGRAFIFARGFHLAKLLSFADGEIYSRMETGFVPFIAHAKGVFVSPLGPFIASKCSSMNF